MGVSFVVVVEDAGLGQLVTVGLRSILVLPVRSWDRMLLRVVRPRHAVLPNQEALQEVAPVLAASFVCFVFCRWARW